MFDLDFDGKISLKYTGKAPEDYDISEIQYTFDFIELVLKKGWSIDDACERVSRCYRMSAKQFKNYLIDSKFILNKSSKKEIMAEMENYTTKDLKKILKRNGFKKSGKRKTLEKRILENRLVGASYSLSSKSKIFYKNKRRRIRIYNEYLKDYYYFNEFNEYYMDNYRKKENKIPTEFVKRFIDHEFLNENHRMYVLNNQVMSEIYWKKDYLRKMLKHVLRNFCINLNPVWKKDELSEHFGIPDVTYNNLMLLKGKLGKNRIISSYYVVWDSFNFEEIMVSKYIGYRYLKDILNLKDYHKLNANLVEKFYSNESVKIKKITQKTLFDF